MALSDHRFLMRSLSVFVCTTLAYSVSAAGINAVVLSASSEIAVRMRREVTFSQAPTPAYLGSHPGKDAGRGVWTRFSLMAANTPDIRTLVAGQAGQSGTPEHSVAVDPESGSAYPWEGTKMVNGLNLNTSNGNTLTELHLLDWAVKGGQTLDLTLYHNSESSYNGELGPGWTWTYNVFLANPTGVPTVHWGDGLCVPYAASGGGGGGTEGGIGFFLASMPFGPSFSSTSYSPPAGTYDKLEKLTDGTWNLTKKDGLLYVFDATGYLTRVTDRNGFSISITQNAQHYATRVADPTGRYIDFNVVDGKYRTATDHTGRVWTFTYDSAGRLINVAWPSLGDGVTHSDSYTYNVNDCILTHTDKRGKVWTSTYNSNHSLASTTDPLGHTTTYIYGTSSTTVTDPLGHTTQDNYSSGILASEVDEASFATSYTARDTNYNPTTVVDKRGKTWTYTYDSNGNVLTQTDPLGHARTRTYNAFSQVLTDTDALSHTTTATYDGAGNLLTQVDPLGKTSSTVTWSGGLPQTMTNALGKTTTITYDANGQVATVTDPLSHTTTATFDNLSRLTSSTDALGHATSQGFDAWSRPISVTYTGGAQALRSYDPEGNVLTATDENGHSSTYAYDDAGRTTSFTNARGDVETYAYDAADRATSVTNGRNKTRTYAYTVRGDLHTLTHADSTLETWEHDGGANVTAYTNGIGQTISYPYDNAGRALGKDYPTGTDVVIGYDAANRRTAMTDASGSTGWTYDAANQVTQLTQPGATMNYTYDDAGRQTGRTDVNTYGSYPYTYTFDDANRQTGIHNGYAENSSDVYDEAGRMVRRNFHTGAYDEFGYDGRNRMTSISRKKSDGTVYSSESYTYDNSGNLLTKTVDGVTTTYTYDNIDQLTGESRTGYVAAYTYDSNGNRLTKTLNGVTETYSYDDGDKLLSVTASGTSKTFGYDAAGRRHTQTTPSGVTTYSYDYDDNLSGIAYPGGLTNSGVYNGEGARSSFTDSMGAWQFQRDGSGVTDAVTYDVKGGRYTDDVSLHNSGLREIHIDRLGTWGSLTDASQNVVLSKTFDAFGKQLSSTGTSFNFLNWAGSWGYYSNRDTDLLTIGHRTYDPSTGTFLTRDPAMDGRNWYGYCRNNPLNWVDPVGTDELIVHENPGGFGAGSHTVVGLRDGKGDTLWVGFYPSHPSGGSSSSGGSGGNGYVRIGDIPKGSSEVTITITPAERRDIQDRVRASRDRHHRGEGKAYDLLKYNCADWAIAIISKGLDEAPPDKEPGKPTTPHGALQWAYHLRE